jgi:hypothetical protein
MPIREWGMTSVFPIPQGLIYLPLAGNRQWQVGELLLPSTPFETMLASRPSEFPQRLVALPEPWGETTYQRWISRPMATLGGWFRRPESMAEYFQDLALYGLEANQRNGEFQHLKLGLAVYRDHLVVTERLFYSPCLLFNSDWNGFPPTSPSGERAFYDAAGFRPIGLAGKPPYFQLPLALEALVRPYFACYQIGRLG